MGEAFSQTGEGSVDEASSLARGGSIKGYDNDSNEACANENRLSF